MLQSISRILLLTALCCFKIRGEVLLTTADLFTNETSMLVTVALPDGSDPLLDEHVSITPADSVTFNSVGSGVSGFTDGLYAVTVAGLLGEGEVLVSVQHPAGDAEITLTRDVTPPTLEMTCRDCNEAPVQRATTYTVDLKFSEPVIGADKWIVDVKRQPYEGSFSISHLTEEGQGDAGSGSKYSLKIFDVSPMSHLRRSQDILHDLLNLTVVPVPMAVSDRAGNRGPIDASVLLIATDLAVSPKQTQAVWSPGAIALVVILGVVVILLAVFVLHIYLKPKKGKYAPVSDEDDPEAEQAFLECGDKVFKLYKGDTDATTGSDTMTLEDIIQAGIRNGFAPEASRVAAEKLISAADHDQDGVLSKEEFLVWLKKVVTKGHRTRKHHVAELRNEFGLGKQAKDAQVTIRTGTG